MFVYVITFGLHTKKVSLEKKDKEAILNVFKEKFNYQDSLKDLWVQCKDDDFDMFIDVDDFSNLPDRGILKILQEENPPKRKVARLEEPQDKSLNGSKVETTSSEGKKSFIDYHLPRFPESVRKALDTDPKKILKESKLKNLLVQTLVDDLKTYFDTPLAQHYRAVGSNLVLKYPELSDKVIPGTEKRGDFLPYATWTEKMRKALKFMRRRNSTASDEIFKMRGKISNNKSSKSTSFLQSSEAVRCDRPQMVVHPTEDHQTILMHRANIAKEWAKPNPDLDIIDDCMERTKGDRHAKYSEAVHVNLEAYPVLSDLIELQKDCCRMLGVKVTENRKKFFTKACVDALKSRLENYAAAKPLLAKAVDEETELQSVLMCLPLLFRETISNWVVINETDVTAHPILRTSADENPLKPILVDVCINGKIISSAQTSIAAGLDALISAIYLWNFEYNPMSRKTFRFYSEVACGFPSVKALPPSVQSLVNGLSSGSSTETPIEP